MSATANRRVAETSTMTLATAEGTAVLANRLSRVTSGQRECLRLVLEHKTSKEIALILGISAHAVDKRLKAAAHLLGVDGRLAAAMLVRDAEETPSRYQRLVYRSPDLAEVPLPGHVAASDHGWSRTDDPIPATEIRDVADGNWLTSEIRPEHAVHGAQPSDGGLPVPWGSVNTLRVRQRLILVLSIAAASALSFGSIVGSLEALRHLL